MATSQVGTGGRTGHERVFNFSAGPAMLPAPVIERAREELGDWHGCGMSIMEVSHRGAQFREVADKAEADLRRLLGVSDDFAILFLQGGATTQFAAVPMNLAGDNRLAAYVNTGTWSKKAIAEARRFTDVTVVADAVGSGYHAIPPMHDWAAADGAVYLHYTSNETIGGVEFHDVPDVGIPLVSDMSSNFLSRPLGLERFALIYAGAQKNIGPAGLTVVIVRKDLVREENASIPRMLDYAAQAAAGSMLNTPPTFAWYMAGLVFEWMLEQGGLEAMARASDSKAAMLYRAIDDSDFYSNPVAPACRSRMNIPFVMADASLDATFLEHAEASGLANLKGHRSVGGMRASIYNAMPAEGVETLIGFMQEFEKRYG